MPKLEPRIEFDLHRHEVANLLDGDKNIGIELGVADGFQSKRLLDTGKFNILYGVDLYGDTHDTCEYKNALKTIGLESRHKLIRSTFDDALDLFPDEYFDFIYIDGFAHTGEEGGKTLADWYGKLKVGGLMSGDDYHADWPLVMWAVNHFAISLGLDITLTGKKLDDKYSQYPTWFFVKKNNEPPGLPDPRLVFIAGKERNRIHKMRTSPFSRFLFRVTRFLSRHTPGSIGRFFQ